MLWSVSSSFYPNKFADCLLDDSAAFLKAERLIASLVVGCMVKQALSLRTKLIPFQRFPTPTMAVQGKDCELKHRLNILHLDTLFED